jgi:hypothetical protein
MASTFVKLKIDIPSVSTSHCDSDVSFKTIAAANSIFISSVVIQLGQLDFYFISTRTCCRKTGRIIYNNIIFVEAAHEKRAITTNFFVTVV